MAVVSEEIRKRNFHAHGSDFTAKWVGSLHIARGQGGQEEKRASARWGVHDATRGLRPRTPVLIDGGSTPEPRVHFCTHKSEPKKRQNQGFGILSAGGVLPASVPFRRANGTEQISFLAFALPLRLHPLAAHAGPRCPGIAGVPSAPIAQCITFSLTPQ